MGEAGEGVEVFKNLFGEFSGSLSLFTNNPYQRKNTAAAAGAQTLSNDKGSSKESLKKGKKRAGKEEESKKAEAEPIIHSAVKKKNKKKKNENVVKSNDGVPDTKGKPQAVALQDINEGAKTGKEKNSLMAYETGGSNVIVEDAPSNGELKKSAKELSSVKREREKRPKRKVVEEEIEEEFGKKFRRSDGKKAKSESHVEDPEIDGILHESIQEENKKQGKRKYVDDGDGVAVPNKKKTKKTKKEVQEEEEKLLRTVFVGNLPTTVKKKQIIREFSQFGKVASARLRSVALVDTKLPRKAAVISGQINEKRTSQNAYVVFEEVESAKAALVYNMTEFQGKHIRVDMATAPRKDSKPDVDNASEFDRTRSLFVGNVPFDVEEEDLYKVFANENPELSVEAIRVPRDPQTGISKGFGFVLFKSKAGANAARAKKSTKVGERYLRVVRMGQQRAEKVSGPTARDRGRSKNNTVASKRLPEGVSSTAKMGPRPWEGARASKSDGKPGKGTLGRHYPRRAPQGGAKTSGDPAPKVRLTKRPAVLARKQGALYKAGKGPAPPKIAGANRRSDKGKGGGKPKKAK